MIAKINLGLIDPNPFRDFDLDPINPATVATMAESITDLDFWGGVVVRPHPLQEGRYQLAFGHHRLEALRSLGKTLDVFSVVPFTDEQMVEAMVTENATQRGSCSSAGLDSVQAVYRLVAYKLLTMTPAALVAAGLVTDEHGAEISRGLLLSGGGIGEQVILAAARGRLNRTVVRASLAALKAGGVTHRLLQLVQARIAEERAAQEDLAETGKTAALRNQAAALATAKANQEKEAAIAVDNTSATATFDPRCAGVFPRETHLAAFQKVVTSENALQYVPVENQLEMARQLVASQPDGKLTAESVRQAATEALLKATRLNTKTRNKMMEENNTAAATANFKKFQTALRAAQRRIEAVLVAAKAGGKVAHPDVHTTMVAEFNALVLLVDEARDLIDPITRDSKVVGVQ